MVVEEVVSVAVPINMVADPVDRYRRSGGRGRVGIARGAAANKGIFGSWKVPNRCLMMILIKFRDDVLLLSCFTCVSESLEIASCYCNLPLISLNPSLLHASRYSNGHLSWCSLMIGARRRTLSVKFDSLA